MAAFARFGKVKYLALVLLLPGLILSLAAFLVSGLWLALLAFPVGMILGYVVQYFFSQ
jgi:putative flippase GtrA